MSTLPLELVRAIANTAHPASTRKFKRLNRFCNALITDTDLQIAEACWRLGIKPARECLFWAVRNGFLRIVSELLPKFSEKGRETDFETGVKITSRDKDVALVWASALGFAEIVSVLLAADADVHGAPNQEAEDNIRGTISAFMGSAGTSNLSWYAYPLSAAAYHGHTSVVLLLLEAGAEMDANDGQALSCLPEKSLSSGETFVEIWGKCAKFSGLGNGVLGLWTYIAFAGRGGRCTCARRLGLAMGC